MRYLRFIAILSLVLIIFNVKKSYTVDPPHDTFQCVICHNTGKISTSNGGLELSRICFECHKPGGYATPINPTPANPYGTSNSIIPQGEGTEHAFMGSDINPQARAERASGVEFDGPQVTGAITCVSCHNPHVQPNGQVGGKFLRLPMTNDELCKRCHTSMDIGVDDGHRTGTHPVNVSMTSSDSMFARPQFSWLSSVYVEKGNKVQCSVCHTPHNSYAFKTPTSTVGKGNAYLGRTYIDSWLCVQCHKKQVHGNSYGSPTKYCTDCHDAHNTSDNWKLLKNKIKNPKTGQIVDVVITCNISQSDFVNSEGTGFCQVCHTKTKRFRNYSTSVYNDMLHGGGGICTECHLHGVDTNLVAPGIGEQPTITANAFKANCTSCHGNPSTGDPTPVGTTYPNYSGSHKRHTSFYKTCMVCHDNPGEAGHDDNTPPADVNVKRPTAGGGFENDITYDYNNKDCSNAYCHGGTLSGRTQTTWRWNENPVLNCTSCHAFPPTNGLHSNHYADGDSDMTECGMCHPNAENYTTVTAVSTHINGVIDVSSGGTSKVTSYNATTKTCANACHNNANWTDTVLSCDACHGNPPNTNAHNSHNSVGISCGACHYGINTTPHANMTHNDAGGSNDGDTLYKRAKGYDVDVNPSRVIEVDDRLYNDGTNSTYNSTVKTCYTAKCHNPGNNGKFADWDSGQTASCTMCHDYMAISTGSHSPHMNASGTFGVTITCTSCHPDNSGNNAHFISDGIPAGQVNLSGTVTFTYTGDVTIPGSTVGSCGTNACHNNGKGGSPVVSTYNWGTSLADCSICHLTFTTGLNTGRHADHSNAYYGPGLATCTPCHTGATNSTHIDGTVQFNDNQILVNTNACNNCHTSDNASLAKSYWNTTDWLPCESCHGGVLQANSKHDGSGVNAPAKTLAETTGHNKLTGNYASGNPAANKACTACHEQQPTSGSHIDHNIGTYVRLTNNDNNLCWTCHGDGGTATKKASTHGNRNDYVANRTERDFSVECRVCHDPHGTNNLVMIRENIQAKYTSALSGTIVFTSYTGIYNSFDRTASGNTAASSICVTCHQGDKDNNVAFTDSGSHVGGDHNGVDYRGDKCTDCHQHSYDSVYNNEDAFMPKGCDTCHGTPGSGNPVPTGAVYPNWSGSHSKHMAYSTDCSICHDNPGGAGHNANDEPYNQADVNVKKPNGTGGFENDITYDYNNKDCSNAYCHGGTLSGRTQTTWRWNENPVLNCTSCHAFPPTNGLHSNHYADGDSDMTECGMCHPNAENYTTVTAVSTHINGVIDVSSGGTSKVTSYNATTKTCANACHNNANWTDTVLSCDACHGNPPNTNAHNSHNSVGISCGACHYGINTTPHANMTHNDAGGSNDGDTLYKRAKGYDVDVNPSRVIEVDDRLYNDGTNSTYNSTVKTCYTAKCHNPGNNGKFADWDSGQTASCTMCHDYMAISTGSHSPHMNASGTFGVTITCTSCHPDNSGNNAHFISDGIPAGQVNLSGTVTFTYTGDVTIPGSTVGSCGTNACHNNGKGGSPVVSTYNWGTTYNNCNFCHQSPITTGRHNEHYNTLYGPAIPNTIDGCAQCHSSQTSSTHINGAVNFRDGNTLNTTTACNNCHTTSGATTAKSYWTTTNWLPCESCHTGSPTANSKYDGTGIYAPDMASALSTGHTKATGTYASGNPAANQACTQCHAQNTTPTDGSGVHIDHTNTATYTRLKYTNDNTLCQQCHVPSAPLYQASKLTDTHGNDNYPDKSERSFSLQCKVCHEVHGTTNLTMIRTEIQSRYTSALPGTIVFTSRTGIYNSYDRTKSGNSAASSICVTCHQGDKDNNVAFTSANSHVGGYAHVRNNYDYRGNVCTNCHTHSYDNDYTNANGFMPRDCDYCHGDETTNVFWPTQAVYPNWSGSHRKHANSFGGNESCYVCHDNPGGPNHFDNNTPLNQADVTIHKPDGSGGWTTDSAYDYNNKDCSNIYCHGGDGTLQGRTVEVWRWNLNPTIDCTSCHGFPPATGKHTVHYNTVPSDYRDTLAKQLTICASCHPGADSYTTSFDGTHGDGKIDIGGGSSDVSGYSLIDNTCTNVCHSSTSTDGHWYDSDGLSCDKCHGNPPATGKHAKHVVLTDLNTCDKCHTSYTDGYTPKSYPNLTHNVVGGTPTDGRSALKDKAEALNSEVSISDAAFNAGGGNTFTHAGQTCSNRLCHNPSGDGHSANWTTGVGSCGLCHNDTATWPATGSHSAHKDAASIFGKSMTCTSCHPNNTSNAHRDSVVSFAANITYTDSDGKVIPSTTYGTCGTNTCHNDGKGGTPVQNPAWGTAIANTPETTACNVCHAFPYNANRHADHYNNTYGPGIANNSSDITGCNQCHNLASSSFHIDGTTTFRDNKDITQTNACNNCHSRLYANTAKVYWTTTSYLACETCHNTVAPAYSKYTSSVTGGVYANTVSYATYTSTGHGRSNTKTYPVSGNVGANKVCLDCHGQTSWTGGTTHISHTTGDFRRLNSTISSDGTAYAACYYCHRSGSTFSLSTGMTRHKIVNYSTKGTPPVYIDCRICHNPHGTSNIEMIKATTDTGWYNGTVVFTARTGTNSFDEDDRGVTNGNNDDLCATCHSATSHNNRTNASTPAHNEGLNCMNCHSHKGEFLATCNSCHAVSETTVRDGAPRSASSSDYPGGHGAHAYHIDKLGLSCSDCHGHNGDAGHNQGGTTVTKANVSLNISSAYSFGGATPTYIKGDGTTRTGTCNNVSCHYGVSVDWKCLP